MKVTFRCDGRILDFYPGLIYTIELTPMIEAALRRSASLTLIDPPSLDQPVPAPISVPEIVPTKTYTETDTVKSTKTIGEPDASDSKDSSSSTRGSSN